MAGEIKISQLPLAGAAQDADVTAGVQSGVTVKQTNSALSTYMQSKILGTTNQVIVTPSGGNIVLSTPQDIALTSSPQFRALNLSGTDSSDTNDPSINFYTNADNYPLMNFVAYTHSNESINFDAYNDSGTWTSSYAGANFQIRNLMNSFYFNFSSGNSPGSALTWHSALILNSSGVWRYPQLTATTLLALDGTNNLISASGGTYNINISGNAATATAVYTQVGVGSSPFYPLFVSSPAGNINLTPQVNNFFTYTPSPGLLNVPQIIVGEPRTTVSCNVKSFVSGTDSSGTDAPGLGFFTSSDSYPLLQIAPFTHGVTALNFDCYSYNGNYYSSYVGSNFQISKVNNQLQFNYRTGISPGSAFGFQPLGYFDSFGNFTLVGKFFMGNPSGSTNALAQFNSTQYGILPPVLNNGYEATLVALLGSVDTGLQWFNSSIGTNNYWDGTQVQNILTTEHVDAGANVSIDYSVPGKITISSSGSGSGPTAAWGSFVIQNSSLTMSVQTTYTAIPGLSGFSDQSSSEFTNQLISVGGIQTPVAVYTGSSTQYFTVNVSLSAFISTISVNNYYLDIFILKANSSIVDTGFINSIDLKNINDAQILSATGSVQLSTGDGVFFQIKADSSANMLVKYLTADVTNKTGSIASTDALSQGTSNIYLSQNGGSTYEYLSGSAIVGDIPQFSSTGGQLIDSGIPAANLIQSTTSLGGSLSGTLPNPSLSSTGISQIIAITQVSGSTQAMTDSALINRYILENSALTTLTLPASMTIGHTIEVYGGGTGLWNIAQNAGQSIISSVLGSPTSTTVGITGYAQASNYTDCITLVYHGTSQFVISTMQTSGAGIILN